MVFVKTMIGNRISEWRLRRRISKAHLARRIRVSRSYVTRLEQGGLQPSSEVMFRIAAYFQCRIEDVFQWRDEDRKASESFAPEMLPYRHRFVSAPHAPATIHAGPGQPDVQLTGPSTRLSSVDGGNKGQIVVKPNGEGRGAACRVSKPKESR